jgi:hypothetical protein
MYKQIIGHNFFFNLKRQSPLRGGERRGEKPLYKYKNSIPGRNGGKRKEVKHGLEKNHFPHLRENATKRKINLK